MNARLTLSYLALGCKVNEYEATAVVNEFTAAGFLLVPFPERADVYLINTCTVTSVADQKSRQMIHKAHRANPLAAIVVMGCFAQLNASRVAAIPGVALVFGTRERSRIVASTLEYLARHEEKTEVLDLRSPLPYEELHLDHFTAQTRGFVKIQDGCNNFCSYCAIPLARGRIASRDPDAAIEEITRLSRQGVREIVLTGINTGTYGQDRGDTTLAALIERIIDEVPLLSRVRVSSIEESEISEELLMLFARHPDRLCSHLHIPLQGGSDAVLSRMHRRYDTATMARTIARIRSLVPTIAITTDVMVGFSGETAAEFQESLAFVRAMGYAELHVFPYSRRPHTLAWTFPDIIDPLTKRARTNEMIALGEELARNYRESFKDRVVEVLVEKNEDGEARGHSREYLEVSFSSRAQRDTLVPVRITQPGYPVSHGEEVTNHVQGL